MKYSLITTDDGSNPGDNLLTENAKRILNNVFNGECMYEFNFSEKPENCIDKINSTDICFFTTVSYLSYDVKAYYDFIKKINIPIIALASSLALQRDETTWTYKLNNEQKEVINIVNRYSDIVPVRDVFTKSILNKNGIKNVKTTGDLGCFNFGNPVQKTKQPSEIKKILITVGHQPVYNKQMTDVVSYLAKKFPDAEITYSTHVSDTKKVFAFSKTKLNGFNIKTIDTSGSCNNLDFYKDFDLHVGYRLHGHIKSLSVGVPSILIAEDFRGVGQKYTLGNAGVFTAFEFNFKKACDQTKSAVRFLGIKILTKKTNYFSDYVETVVKCFGIKFKKKTSLIKSSEKLIAEIDKYIDMSVYTNWTFYTMIPSIINNLYRNSFLPFLRDSINNASNRSKN